jgi:hypothetical protein
VLLSFSLGVSVNVTVGRGYFFISRGVGLNQALIDIGLDFLEK